MTAETIRIQHEGDVVAARQKGRKLARKIGFSDGDLALIPVAISEIAQNIVLHAGRGEVTISTVTDDDREGILVVATDHGPGIPDIGAAMTDGFSTAKSLGIGLAAAQRIMDEFDIVSDVGKGTVVTMKKWKKD